MKNKFKKILVLLILIFSGCTSHVSKQPFTLDRLERATQELVFPPSFLPVHTQTVAKKPKTVEIRLVVEEKEIQVSGDVTIQAMTFNGSEPDPIIVVHQDDYVELTLVNPKTSLHMHNIDFHAATGALGGGPISKVKPGEEVTIRFKATKAGAFVYHCAPFGSMIPYHVVAGMNGVIMVLPREGLKDNNGKSVHYDKAFYIADQDYYIPTDEYGEFRRYSSVVDAL
jgi:nitrite reductase (NO-forming)